MLHPIYVGKAVTPGARKGATNGSGVGRALFNRLDEHRQSVIAAKNLDIDDFWCRYLRVTDAWIAPAEAMMIQQYQPVWNCCVDGFGNNDPGKGRSGSKRSRWDTLHPGRTWADRLVDRPESLTTLENVVKAFLSPDLLATTPG